MTDPRAAEGVEHLQRAAREMLKAARSFLDVVEDVVEDPERLTGAAAGFADLVRSGLGRQDAPWTRAAWADDLDRNDGPDTATETDTDADTPDIDMPDDDLEVDVRDGATVGPDDHADEPDAAPEPDDTRPVAGTPPQTGTGPTPRRNSRVRRIAVD
ncbi:hypothetical protein BH10ACT3_BH10ACT3_09670 [soil metagenome]